MFIRLNLDFYCLAFIFLFICNIITTPDNLNAQEVVSLSQIETDFKNQEYAKVAEASRLYLTLDPKNTRIQKLLLDSNYKIGKFREVYRLHKEEVEYITDAEILKLRSLAHFKEGNFFSAVNSVKRLKSLQSLNNEWNRFYYYLIFKINNKSALEDLKKLNKYNPSIDNSILFSDLLILAQQSDKAISVIDSALKKDYLNVTLLEKSGDTHFSAKNYENAINTYINLIKLYPERNDLKLKLARSYFKSNSIVQAQNILANLKDEESTNYKMIVDKISDNLLKNPNPRILTNTSDEFNDKSHIDLRQKIELSMMPIEYEKTAVINSLQSENVILSNKTTEEFDFQDQHLLEFSVSPKAKSYSLRGIGFNAEVDYSNGISFAGNYTFHPENRNWNLNLGFSQSHSKFDKLSGLTPDSIDLNEINVNLFGLYFYNNFFIGPQFIYESINTTQTSPNTIRGNIDFFNVGLMTGYQRDLSEKWNLSFQVGFNENIVTTSKTILVGTVEKRSQYNSSLQLIYKSTERIKYKISVQYSQTDTSYAGSESRGVSKAREKEADWMIPLGIIYEI